MVLDNFYSKFIHWKNYLYRFALELKLEFEENKFKELSIIKNYESLSKKELYWKLREVTDDNYEEIFYHRQFYKF